MRTSSFLGAAYLLLAWRLPWHCLDTGDLFTLGILAAGRSNMDLSIVLEPVGFVKYTASLVGARDGNLAIRGETDGRDQTTLREFIPKVDLLLRNIPQA